LSSEGVAGMQQSTSTNGNLTVQMLERNWIVIIDQEPTAQ